MNLVAFLFIATFCVVAHANGLPQPPFVLNCGPKSDESSLVLTEAREQRALYPNRLVQLPDLPFGDSTGFGHRGGEGYRHWHGGCRPALGPQWEADYFASGRTAPGS